MPKPRTPGTRSGTAAGASSPRGGKLSKLIQAGLDRRNKPASGGAAVQKTVAPVVPAAPVRPVAPAPAVNLAPRELQVDADRGGQRLDNFLLGQLKGVPRTLVYRLLRKGAVRVNGKRAKQDQRLEGGETIALPEIRQATAEQPMLPSAARLSWLEARIVFEDAGLLVLDKPVGLACHGGSGLSFGAIEALRAIRPEQTLELVHRLDRDTSGLLLIAKKRSVLAELQDQIRAGGIDKRYLALLQGRIRADRFECTMPLLKNTLNSGERVVRVDAAGKPAHTRFQVVERFAACTLVECELLTGRTHQIRVHTRHEGHPIVGDSKYGDPQGDALLPAHEPARMWLHAWRLQFELNGRSLRFEAPEPAELQALRVLLRG